jgi:hypothetical protein
MTAIYPTGVATDADLLTGVNNLQTTLDGALGATGDNTGGNGIALTSTVNFPTTGVATIENEIVYYTGITGNNLTGTVRGYDNTIGVTHNSGVSVSLDYIAMHHNALKDEIEAIEDDLFNGIRPNAFQNILVNPSLEVWQRGVTFSGVPSGSQTADRWYLNFTGAPSFTVSRTAVAGAVVLGQYALQLQLTAVGGATTYTVRQSIENYRDFRGKTVSLSIWVNSSVPGVKAFITNGTIATSLSAAHSGGSTYQRLTCSYTVPINSNELTIGVGFIDVAPSLSAIYIDSAMVCFGSKPADYIPISPHDDMARCERYYETGRITSAGLYTISATQFLFLPRSFKVKKANVPTVTASGLDVFNSSDVDDSVNWAIQASETVSLDEFSLRLYRGTYVAGGYRGRAYWVGETT